MTRPSKGFVAALIVVVTLAVAAGGGYALVNWASSRAREDLMHRVNLEQWLAGHEAVFAAEPRRPVAPDWSPEDWPRRLGDLETTRPVRGLRIAHRAGDGPVVWLRDDPAPPHAVALSETLLRTPTEGPVTTLVQELDAETRFVAIRHEIEVSETAHVFLATWTEDRP